MQYQSGHNPAIPELTVKILASADIDFRSVGNTIVFTVPSGFKLYMRNVVMELINITGSVSVDGVYSVGANGTTYNDWGSFSLSPDNYSDTTSYLELTPAQDASASGRVIKKYTAGQQVRFRVVTAPVGTTVYSGKVHFVGTLIPN